MNQCRHVVFWSTWRLESARFISDLAQTLNWTYVPYRIQKSGTPRSVLRFFWKHRVPGIRSQCDIALESRPFVASQMFSPFHFLPSGTLFIGFKNMTRHRVVAIRNVYRHCAHTCSGREPSHIWNLQIDKAHRASFV